MKAQADAAKQGAIETARPKVAEEKAKPKAELRALEAEKARLQQQREPEAACAHEEAKKRATEATSAVEDGRKIRRQTPPGASRVDTLWWSFDGDWAFRMKIGLDAQDSRSGKGSSPATPPRRKGKQRTSGRPRRSAERHLHDSNPFVSCSDGDGGDCRHC